MKKEDDVKVGDEIVAETTEENATETEKNAEDPKVSTVNTDNMETDEKKDADLSETEDESETVIKN